MIGRNSLSSEYIVQIRHFSPTDIACPRQLEKLPQTQSVGHLFGLLPLVALYLVDHRKVRYFYLVYSFVIFSS